MATAAMSPADAARIAHLRVKYRRKQSQLTFAKWLPVVTPEWQWDAPHLQPIIGAFQQMLEGDIDKLMVFMPPRHGKALALDTPISTPDGWSTMGELQVGDRVFDELGRPCNVIAVSPIWKDRPVYRVTTDDGDEIVADELHEWRARLCGKRPVFKLHTTKVLSKSRQKRAMIERQLPLQLPDQEFAVDPYVLGFWLGDGTTKHATITVGDEDREFVELCFNEAGHEVKHRTTHNTFGFSGAQTYLRESGLINGKFVPPEYLRGSARQRLELLQGIVDSDGSVHTEGQITITTNRKDLADGYRELIWSLGCKASLNEYRASIDGRDCGPCWKVSFYMREAARLPRKRLRCRESVKTQHRYVTATPVGNADTKCITVDSESHLFLAGRSMLPTHNSEALTVRGAAYVIEQNPATSVIVAAHTHMLAQSFSRKTRRIVRERVGISDERAATDEWETLAGGTYRAVGIGGGIAGHGGSWIFIDDPVKSREQADSQTYRDRAWEWYTDDLMTRRAPNAKMCLIMTRWHMDDLAGRILESDDAPNWEVIHLPAIALEDDLLGRVPGEALWPERYPAEFFTPIRDQQPRTYSALYQGMPQPEGGAVFLADWWDDRNRYDPRETFVPVARVMFWDTAEEANDSAAYTVAVVGELGADYRLRIVDVVRQRVTFPNLVPLIERTAQRHNHDGLLRAVSVEYASSGRQAYQTIHAQSPDWLRRVMQRYTPRVSKELRAQSAAAWCQNGMVLLPLPDISVPWLHDFERELYDFPTGKYKDQADAFSGLVNRLKRELTMGYQQRAQPVREVRN